MKVKAISEDLFLNKRKIKIGDLAEKQKDLITDGEAIKTGRKIDGKDEYIKRFGFTGLNSNGQEIKKPLGFELDKAIITGFEGASKSNTNNWFYFTDSQATSTSWALYFTLGTADDTIRVYTINANLKEAYINVKYILIND